ncbi:hypothetical protein MSAN_00120500 [Mycena sanguinolenta]|uniref:Uncharacterized protein n=1 Tax=Mycena sanguinolenta TaxID=230812 RepID=A0A8H6ZGD6_9AGAR|nr:hypothetical protein MSAN_00120500 [Mycena sanguinolenta]
MTACGLSRTVRLRLFPGISSLDADAETITAFINSLTLEQYHRICDWNLGQRRSLELSASTTVNLGAVYRRSNDQVEDGVEIAFLPSAEAPYVGHWTISGGIGEVMPSGWTRFQSSHTFNRTLSISFSAFWDTWLSQVNHIFLNHIFRRLNIMSNFDDYGTAFAHCFYLG